MASTPAPQQHWKAAVPSNTQSQTVSYLAWQDGTGAMFTGHGQPMDLDQMCLKCSTKQKDGGICRSRWHVPSQPVQTRQMEVKAGKTKLATKEGFLAFVRRFAEANPKTFKKVGFGLSIA